MRSFPSALAALIAASFALCAPLHAQPAKCEKGAVVLRLVDRYSKECIEHNDALQKRKKEIEAAFERKDESSASWTGRAREQLGALLRQADTSNPPYQGPLTQSLKEAIAQISLLPDLTSLAARETYPALQLDTWNVGPRRNQRPDGLGASTLYDASPACADENDAGTSATCRQAFDRAVQVADYVYLAGQVMVALHKSQGKSFHELATLREKRWHAYLYDTQFQYFWELGLNRWREETCFDRAIVALFDECKRPVRDKHDNPLGFREPPTNRAIFLHPDIGLQYIDAEPDGDRFKPTLLIQWFGYQWWDWKDNSEKITGLRGVSFVSTLSDNATAKTLGWGAMFQVNQYAVAFTGHGSKLAVTLNLTLGDKISKLNDDWANKLKRLKD